MNDYNDLIENNTYWIFYENKWSPVIVVIPYSNNDKYFKFFNGGIIECKRVLIWNIEPLVHTRIYNKKAREITGEGFYMSIDDFKNEVETLNITKYDGIGYWCKNGFASNEDVFETPVEDADAVLWLNK